MKVDTHGQARGTSQQQVLARGGHKGATQAPIIDKFKNLKYVDVTKRKSSQ